MKKLMRKLVLSCFALGLAVVTLSTTTFAWYTANTKVTADKIGGTSADAGAELLMITQDTKAKSEGSEIVYPVNFDTKVADVTESQPYDAMRPVAKTDTWGVYSVLGAAQGEDLIITADGDAKTSDVITFTLYFKNASNEPTNLYIKNMILTNTTGTSENDTTVDLPIKDVLNAGRGHLLAAGDGASTYTIDVLRTLMMDIKSEVYEGGVNNIPESAKENTTLYQFLNLEKIATLNSDSFVDGTSNAHEYYNAIMDETLEDTTGSIRADEYTVYKKSEETNDYNPLMINEVPEAGDVSNSNSYLKVQFVIFINGWDLACFDAVQGQTFNLKMEFTTVDTDALRIKTTKAPVVDGQ